ncbi:DsbA family oxidoreductase, partial [Parapedomonas caeni]
ANSTITMNPVATSDAAFRGGACPTPEYTIAYTGNYTTSADANERLFAAYFTEGRDVGNAETLAALAGDVGLDPTLVAALLAGEADRALIHAEVEEAHRLGVNGVPTFIIDGKWSVTGAQPPEIWQRVFDKLVDAKSGVTPAA